jgi:hypothetical protein
MLWRNELEMGTGVAFSVSEPGLHGLEYELDPEEQRCRIDLTYRRAPKTSSGRRR